MKHRKVYLEKSGLCIWVMSGPVDDKSAIVLREFQAISYGGWAEYSRRGFLLRSVSCKHEVIERAHAIAKKARATLVIQD